MRILAHQHARRLAVVTLAIGLSAMSIGCSISSITIGGSVGRGTNGRVTGAVTGSITFKTNVNGSPEQLMDEDTGQVYADDGTLDYSGVSATQGTTSGGTVYQTSGGSSGGDSGCGSRYCLNEPEF
jgi:hypothetical protein